MAGDAGGSYDVKGMSSAPPASRSIYVGLFLVTFATLMYEIALTRIFSVTMWYHFAFVAISVAMFGMTVGALIVYLRPAWFPPERVAHGLGASALLFGVAIVVGLLTQLVVPFTPELSLLGMYTVALTYVVVATPFIFSGICVTLALTRFPRQLPALYGVDLLGAAAGLPMGMAFPLGMRMAASRTPALAPWLWGINGATSVCASVIAVAIALHWGIAAAFWTGVACYVAATGALAAMSAGLAAAPIGVMAAPVPARPEVS